MYLYDIIRQQLEAQSATLKLPQQTCVNLYDSFQILCADSLQQPVATAYNGLSRINPNGLPFQWSFCLNNDLPALRFVCESGLPGTSAYTRYQLSLKNLETLCRKLQIPYPDWLREIALKQLMPKVDDWPAWWDSALWFALGARGSHIHLKIYLNLDYGTPLHRWQRAARLLRELGRHSALTRLCDLSGEVSHDSWPTGLALDILPNGEAGRVKIYFHSGEVYRAWLNNWYRALGADAELAHLSRMLKLFPWPQQEAYPAKAFFVSLEFGADDEVSLKTDLTVSRWMPHDSATLAATDRLATSLGLATDAYHDALRSSGLWPNGDDRVSLHHLVGFGYESDGSRHINVYCEPALKQLQSSATITPAKTAVI